MTACHDSYMTTQTHISQTIRRNHVAATVEVDGVRFGHVISRGVSFTAARKHGSATDIRRHATNFKTVEAATRWIESAA